MQNYRPFYCIRFASPSCTDLEGAYFDTNSVITWSGDTEITFNHGIDQHFKADSIGVASLERDFRGIRIIPQLEVKDQHGMYLLRLFAEGHLWWSTEAGPHQYEMREGQLYVKSWEVIRVSLTPVPCEPWLAQNPFRAPLSDEARAEANTRKTTPQQGPQLVIKGVTEQPPEAEKWYVLQKIRNINYQKNLSHA